MAFTFSARSNARLDTVHPDLRAVARRAIQLTKFDFGITAGKRTAAEQYELFTKKASQLDGYNKISRHQTGHAIDFVVWFNGNITWDFKYYEEVSKAFKQASKELGIPVVWGGDWSKFKDGPHVELDKRHYAQ